eukprot:NODE_218_length_14160_cov_0.274874.p3 type:complete len:639 gc:universal NODE_218_length_14160_cov_0.274874:2053-3969(+)
MPSIQVAVRVRPFSQHELLPAKKDNDQFFQPKSTVQPLDEKVIIFDPNLKNKNSENRLARLATSKRYNKDIKYGFDRVFDMNSTQQQIFQHLCQPLLMDVMNGYHATIFAYGATGAGKTYTITGVKEDPGIIFQSLDYLFAKLPTMQKAFQVEISYLEIYNEQLRDLLKPESSLQLRENGSAVMVANISKHSPQSANDVMQLITIGNKRRSQSPTEANANSSRSHAILQVTVKMRIIGESNYTESILSIIDLAGSERASATVNKGQQRRREGANINRSLLALGNCINALCTSTNRHVPYRDSKLTRLLKQSLSGNCKTVMICNISPHLVHYEETLNTLKYANRAKNIQVNLVKNVVNVKLHVHKYLQMIEELKLENKNLKLNQQTSQVDQQTQLQTILTQVSNKAALILSEVQQKQLEGAHISTRLHSSRIGIECISKVINLHNSNDDEYIRIKLLCNSHVDELEQLNGLLLTRQGILNDQIEGLMEQLNDLVDVDMDYMTRHIVTLEIEKMKSVMTADGLKMEMECMVNNLYTQVDLISHVKGNDLIEALDLLRNNVMGIKERPLPRSKSMSDLNIQRVDSKEDIRLGKHDIASSPSKESRKKVKFNLKDNMIKEISPRRGNVFQRLFPSPSKKRKD